MRRRRSSAPLRSAARMCAFRPGCGAYLDDLEFADPAYAVVVRSPHARARIRPRCAGADLAGSLKRAAIRSINPFHWRECRHLVGEGVEVHRAVAEADPTLFVAPGEGVLETIVVVALRLVFAGVGAAAFAAVAGAVQHDRRLPDQIV